MYTNNHTQKDLEPQVLSGMPSLNAGDLVGKKQDEKAALPRFQADLHVVCCLVCLGECTLHVGCCLMYLKKCTLHLYVVWFP